MTNVDKNLDFYQTNGNNVDKTLTVKRNGVDINWTTEGYVSGKMQVRDKPSKDGTLIAGVDVDISVNGQITFSTDDPIDVDVKVYFYDVLMTMSDGKLKTLWNFRKFNVKTNITEP